MKMTTKQKSKLLNLADIILRETVDWTVLEALKKLLLTIPNVENEIDIYISNEIKANWDAEDCKFRKEELLTFIK